MKRGITATQITPYTLLIVVLAVVMLFGFRAIRNTTETGDEIFITALKQQLENDFDSIQFGDVLMREYKIPREYSALCFTDSNPVGLVGCNPDLCPAEGTYPLLEDAAGGDAASNVFLLGEGAPETDSLGNLALYCCELFCFETQNGRVKVTIEGTGEGGIVKTI